MSTTLSPWLKRSVDDLQRLAKRGDSAEVVACLSGGLTTLRNLFCARIWGDVEKRYGVDSMCVPVSAMKARVQAYQEIEAYEIAEAAAAVGEFGCLTASADSLMPWLGNLLRKTSEPDAALCGRAREFLSRDTPGRTRLLMDNLARIVPESFHSPLVLYQLLPLCVQIAVASAFGERAAAEKMRRRQVSILPSIADCRRCRGWVLDCAEPCPTCGNPLWKFEWLAEAED